MTDEQPFLLKASDINAMEAFEFHHPLNPNSEIYLRFLGRAVGFKRIGVTIARVPPGKESFIYHAHQNEEEWVYSICQYPPFILCPSRSPVIFEFLLALRKPIVRKPKLSNG